MIIRTADEVAKAIELVKTQLEVSFDVETTGLSVRKDQVIGLSCAAEGFSFYIILKEWNGSELVTVIDKTSVAPLLQLLKSRRLITHNGSFDTRITYHYFGIELWNSIYADTMLMAHTSDENKFDYGLKTLGREVFGESAVAEREEMKESIKQNGGDKNEFYKANSELLALYGRKDAELTFNLYKHLKKQLHYNGLTKFFMNDEVMPLYREVTIPMELKGVPVDLPFLQQTRLELEADLSTLENEIQTSLTPHLDLFTDWYLNKEYPVKLTGPFIQKYAELQNVELPKTKTGAFSLTASNIEKLPDCKFKRIMLRQARFTDAEILEVQKALQADSGQKYIFNILSKDHLKRLFFTKLKETPLSKTDKGNPQIDDEFLELMAAKYDWAAKLRTFNRLTKINGTYVGRILDEQEDGIFYPSFAQHRTVSGRYGSDFQQLPRPIETEETKIVDGKKVVVSLLTEVSGEKFYKQSDGTLVPEVIVRYNNRIRQFFIAGPGFKFVDDDYESLEPHVFAHVSSDPALIEIFNNNQDFYSTVAIRTEGLQNVSADKKAPNYLGKVNKAARQKAKAYALGIAYGMSGYKLAFELNIGQSEAEKLVANYLNAFPKLKELIQTSKEFACKNGYSIVESGRIRRFPELKRIYAEYGEELFDSLALWKKYNEMPATYERMKELRRRCNNYVNNSINVKIQGLASSIVNRACIAIARELRGTEAYICAQIHDQIVVRCPNDMTEKVCEIVQRNMENIYPLSLRLKAVPSTGNNLAESKG